MASHVSRRSFLKSAAAGGTALGLGELGFLCGLPPVSAADAAPEHGRVRLRAEIEPLVTLIEDSSRDRLLEEIADRIHKGTTYQDILAALLLAGVCNVRPRPSVGFKFHAVLVVNSAHLASLASPDHERWLPLFWALDNFKSAQAQNQKESGWRMPPLDEGKVPTARKARKAFVEAMDSWDEQAADAAVIGLARSAGSHEVFELFCRYGARDFRDIGHKAIFVANSWRTLQTVGWQHAEPVLRSLAYALLKNDGTNPATADLPPDRPGRKNKELADKFRPDWQAGGTNTEAGCCEATTELLSVLRQANAADAAAKFTEAVNGGASPQTIWDALFLGAGELLLRQPGIVALHAVTSTNALHYAYQASADDVTRRWLILQNASFVTLFRDALGSRGKVGDAKIDALTPLEPEKSGADAVAELFAEVSKDRLTAARKTLGYVAAKGDPRALMDAARLLVFFKGNDSHDYKFSSAHLEDIENVSPEWRDRFLAAGMMNFKGSGAKDIPLVQRARAALNG
ncbi:MAG TPA: twin-arginine translocation signal domain-containing protein [Gemmataceae bacterium]|jgi:hypothetical protein|nr:twin-arginine translocation signal domain-containing protein [Gemmataceae bacterium]